MSALAIITHFTPSPTAVTILGIIVVSSTLIALAAILLLHLLPTGYNPIHNAVSDYGVGRYHVLYQTEAVFLGIAGYAVFAASASTAKPQNIYVLAFLSLFATARVIIAFFPTDLPRQPRTQTGRVHGALAFIGFLSVAAAAVLFKGTLLDQAVGLVLGLATTIMVLSLNLPSLRRVFGLAERVFYACTISWLLVLGIELLLLVH
jgi:hypothetical membrane protein